MAKRKSEWFDWLKAALIALGLAFIVRTFLFTPIIVDGPSMFPTLHDRDQMIVNKFKYRFQEPDRFDIVVFHASDKKDFIKRVIGLPGEHVEYKDNNLYINGEKKEELFFDNSNTTNQIITSDFSLEELPGGYEKIPDNHVLVLGDNRTNSTDSRILGVISMDQIVGNANIIYWPFERMQNAGE
ncbi:signal peptidase I [Ornithinibacillus halophilus]|uniref:Signal peptidase I n=1 Tax=Ornithinibacillus halophilus TaxID=930117 RepID=A0A1M5C8L0_9BACI|nr:signal peptidase I [Ornithinibacillus halophilus]SHF51089.1 signal peptidase I [Ornithinibacillus halophilus]